MSSQPPLPLEPSANAATPDPYAAMVAELEASQQPHIKITGPDGESGYILGGSGALQIGTLNITDGEGFKMETQGKVEVGEMNLGYDAAALDDPYTVPLKKAENEPIAGSMILLALIVLGFLGFVAALALRSMRQPNP